MEETRNERLVSSKESKILPVLNVAAWILYVCIYVCVPIQVNTTTPGTLRKLRFGNASPSPSKSLNYK
jgi:hypothetical protein